MFFFFFFFGEGGGGRGGGGGGAGSPESPEFSGVRAADTAAALRRPGVDLEFPMRHLSHKETKQTSTS